MEKNETKSGGRYLSEPPKKSKKKKKRLKLPVLAVAGFVLIAVVVILLLNVMNGSVYRTLVKAGYSGSQEQLLASLVGEEMGGDQVRTAYSLACENGYEEGESVWLETLTGVAVEAAGKSPYEIACANGFRGSFAEWLEEIADNPEKLGRSKKNGKKTGYEMACEYGYEGSFTEWLISVSNDKVF